MTETGTTQTIGDVTLPVYKDELSFTVPPVDKIKPEQAHRAGEKYKKEFSFAQVTSNDEAEKVCKSKEWTLVDFVNDALKSAARSSAYQSEASLYARSEVSAEDIKERMVRDYIRLGIPEDVARTTVNSMLAAVKG